MPRMIMKTPVRRVQSMAARFEKRFVNGQWSVFDRRNFGHGPGVGTEKAVDRLVHELNEGRRVWSA